MGEGGRGKRVGGEGRGKGVEAVARRKKRKHLDEKIFYTDKK